MDRVRVDRGTKPSSAADAAPRTEDPVPQQDLRPPAPGAACPGLLRSVGTGDDEIGGSPVPGDVLQVLQRTRGQGAALPPALGATMGSELGADLSGVRIHTGSESDAAARSLRAVAFASGADLHFRAGAYDPSTDRGRRLLAHEVSHVVQPQATSAVPMVGRADDPAERAADRSAGRIVDALRRSPADGTATSDAPIRRQVPAALTIRRMTDGAATTAMKQGQWVWMRGMDGPHRVLIRSVDNGAATVEFNSQQQKTADLADLSEELPSMTMLAHWIASYLVSREQLENQLGLEFVQGEVLLAFQHIPAVLPYVTTACTDPWATTSDVINPVRESLREFRDLRHVSWLHEQRVAFDKELKQRRITPRGSTLREHSEVTDSHYTALDAELGMPGMLWRFTSNPTTEFISIGAGVDFAKIVQLIAGHTGGNKKDDGSVRTLSFGRNVGALVGVAHSKGGDANVAAINARAEYLYGVSLDSLKGQGITAHPAEARMIGVFETEYVLVGTPGAPPRRLEDLATAKYRNPFKTASGGQIPDLPAKAIAPVKPHVADPPSPDLTDAPEGFRAKVVAYAQKVAAAATTQAHTVQDKEGVDSATIERAVAKFIKDIDSYNPLLASQQPVSSGSLLAVKPARSQLSSGPRSLIRSSAASSRVQNPTTGQTPVRTNRPPVEPVRQQRITTPKTPEKDPDTTTNV